MIRALGCSLSGIISSFKVLDTASNNIANAETNGYKAKSVVLRESHGGVATSTATDNSPGHKFQLDGRIFEASNVNIASEMVSLITARHMFSFNAAAFKTATEMEKSLIDTLA
jgi:flagellar basal body rod protein FlgG